ncbi:unannotated protein [freshwater metagenome]|uniref:Unannotated protein n=1 Tax=freshwater metagenome TaxID=449393 RepID=A0A6J7EE92_9ZZZZ
MLLPTVTAADVAYTPPSLTAVLASKVLFSNVSGPADITPPPFKPAVFAEKVELYDSTVPEVLYTAPPYAVAVLPSKVLESMRTSATNTGSAGAGARIGAAPSTAPMAPPPSAWFALKVLSVTEM